MKVEDIEVELVHPAPENPNEMTERMMKALRTEITLRGFIQPVLVRPHPEKENEYQIIDGEHRWRIMGELGMQTIPCVVDYEASDLDADVRRLTMNRLRGEFVPIRIAHLLADLQERIPESEIRARLALDESELRSYYKLAGLPVDEETKRKRTAVGAARVELTFSCTQEQATEVEGLLDELTDSDPEREPAVLARLARNWMAGE